jgi:hypothetical protein
MPHVFYKLVFGVLILGMLLGIGALDFEVWTGTFFGCLAGGGENTSCAGDSPKCNGHWTLRLDRPGVHFLQ